MFRSSLFAARPTLHGSKLPGVSSLYRMQSDHVRRLRIARLDHLVITCADIERTISFYQKLGMRSVEFGGGEQKRKALSFGEQKINLHQHGKEFEPKAHVPQPGSQDLCFVIEGSIVETQEHLANEGIQVIEGPVRRTGANGPILSVYVRDPDGNLIELSSYSDAKE